MPLSFNIVLPSEHRLLLGKHSNVAPAFMRPRPPPPEQSRLDCSSLNGPGGLYDSACGIFLRRPDDNSPAKLTL